MSLILSSVKYETLDLNHKNRSKSFRQTEADVHFLTCVSETSAPRRKFLFFYCVDKVRKQLDQLETHQNKKKLRGISSDSRDFKGLRDHGENEPLSVCPAHEFTFKSDTKWWQNVFFLDSTGSVFGNDLHRLISIRKVYFQLAVHDTCAPHGYSLSTRRWSGCCFLERWHIV